MTKRFRTDNTDHMFSENDLIAVRIYRQHLTSPVRHLDAASDLNGFQSQFITASLHSLRIRSLDIDIESGMVRNWTVHGTMHIFAENDLPVFLHDPEHYRSLTFSDTYYGSDGKVIIAPNIQRYWSEKIISYIENSIHSREDLKKACISDGMSDEQLEIMFDQWGGGIRTLCERGFINCRLSERKEYDLSPIFEPLSAEIAETEIIRRYFASYGPASVRDAAYYCGCSQKKIREIMSRIPLESVDVNGTALYYSGDIERHSGIPDCLLLGGFDQLMLGYFKESSLFLPREYLRGIFTLSGIVMPAVLYRGKAAGRWKKNGKMVKIEMFCRPDTDMKKAITDKAESLFSDLREIRFAEI